jgi:predicted lipid-binding transport protein (Tim44 family)
MRKVIKLVLCLSLVFSVTATVLPVQTEAASYAKAYRSPKGSYKAPAPKSNTGAKKTTPDSNTKAPGAAASTTPKRSFFGGGFARGLFLGGIAGLMFGGLFGNMGFLGQMLGLFVNVFAILAVIMAVRSLISYFRRKRYSNSNRRY